MRHAPFLWLRTVRHFPLPSLWQRLRLKLRKKFYRPVTMPAALVAEWSELVAGPGATPAFRPEGFEAWQFLTDSNFQAQVKRQAQLLVENQQGVLLNQPFPLPDHSIFLQDELLGQTPLWRENYNYLAFLLPLVWQITSERQVQSLSSAAINRLESQLKIFWELPFSHRYWSTYGVSRRILTYVECLPILALLSSEIQQSFWENFYQDSCYLAQCLEWDVQGNHLIQNLTAWLAATAVLRRLPVTQAMASQWLATLYRLLPTVFSGQILPDGFHFERTPMYHVWVLRDLLECLVLLQALPGSQTVLDVLYPVAERMLKAGIAVLHANGDVPMFGDASLPQCPDFSALTKYAQEVAGVSVIKLKSDQAFLHLPQTGFAVFRNTRNTASLILDCGDFAPRHLPAHGHCDLGSFELHGKNGPLIVDSGVSEYVPSLLRDYFRGTAAHNAIWFPGEEQAEIWGSFRVAEYPRFQGCQVQSLPNSEIKMGHLEADCAAEQSLNRQLSLSYENYSGDYVHQRIITHHAQRFWVITDRVKRLRQPHQAGWSLLHIHPDCKIEKQGDSFIVDHQLLIVPFGVIAAEWSNQAPWRGNLNLYSAGFNLAKPGQIIALSPDVAGPFGWVLIPFQTISPPQYAWDGEMLILEFPEGDFESDKTETVCFKLNPASPSQCAPSLKP